MEMIYQKNNSNKKLRLRLDFLYIFILTVYTGQQCAEFMGIFFFSSFFSVLIPFVFTCYIIYEHHVKFNKAFYWVAGLILAWYVCQYIFNGYFNITDCGFMIYNVLLAYVAARTFKVRFLVLFERSVYILAGISLVGWMISVLGGRQLLETMAPFDGNAVVAASYGVFGVPRVEEIYSMHYTIFLRNSGFCTEPGHFSSLLGIAILFNMVIKRFKVVHNVHLYVLVLALLTTQSTTGYVLMGTVIIPMYLLNYRNRKLKIGGTVLAILLTLVLGSTSIVSSKIQDNVYEKEKFAEIIDYQEETDDYTLVAQRFDSFMIEMINFRENLLIGYGTYIKSFFYENVTKRWIPSNGFATVFAKYGLFIGLLFYVFLIRSAISFGKLFQIKFSSIIVLLVCGILFSYDHQAQYHILYFVLFDLFYKKELIVRYEKNLSLPVKFRRARVRVLRAPQNAGHRTECI